MSAVLSRGEFIVSLCGCLHIRIPPGLKPGKPHVFYAAVQRRMAQHYRENPECDAKAEADPVWQMRVPISKEKADRLDE